MNPMIYAEAMKYFDLGDVESISVPKDGLRYPISQNEDYVDVFVRSYDADVVLGTDEIITALNVWLMRSGFKPLCIFSEAYTSTSLSPKNQLEETVHHPEYGEIDLKVEFQYVWGDEE